VPYYNYLIVVVVVVVAAAVVNVAFTVIQRKTSVQ
jgi:hypothetical protein